MDRLLKAACAITLMLAGACAPAPETRTPGGERDAVVARAWLDDPGGTLSPETALGHGWTPFEGSLARGYPSSTTWARLRIDPAAAGPPDSATEGRLVLFVMPSHLDEVAVFRADRLSESPLLVGDVHTPPRAGRALLSHTVVFDDATAPFEVLLRLRTEGTHSLDVHALRWSAAQDEGLQQHALVIAYLVFTLMVMAWAAAAWLENRDRVVALFIAHEATALAMALLVTGLLRMYGPGWLSPALNRLTALSVPLYSLVTMLFHVRLLGDLDVRRTEPRLLRAFSLVPLLGMLLVALGQVHAGLFLNQVSVPAMVLISVASAWGVQLQPPGEHEAGDGLRRVQLGAVYVAMASLTVPPALRTLGLFPAGRWSFLGFMAYGVASAVLMGLLLSYRAVEERRRRRRAELAHAQVQREADAHRARATEQSEFLTMLTHELKTPLSVVSLALGDSGRTAPMRARALRAIDNMREVVDRCEQTARYDDQIARLGASPAVVPIQLEEILSATIDALLHTGRVDHRVAEGLPACLADRQMALIIVGNLLENALKYGPADGRVRATVETATHDGRLGVSLRVANRVGPAGKPDPMHLFDKYHRGVRARGSSGAGLGLYLSHRLASRLGGALSLCDRPGDDSDVEFELWLPC